MKIGIDFDRVLFKTEEFKKHLFKEFEEFEETYEKALENGVYNPEKHANLMGVTTEELFQELQNTPDFLYEDVEKLQEFPDDCEIIIVSRGDPIFQKEKIIESGITELVEDYYLVQDEPKDKVDIDFLVDDREKELEKISVPGFLFNREKHSVDDIIRKVKELNA